MSEVAYSNAYASQAAYQQSSVDLNKTQGAGDLYTGSAYQGGALQSSVDSALVEALLQVLVGLAQNQGLPKYKLNEIIDFLKNFLSNGGSVGAGNGSGAVGEGSLGDNAAHLDPGEVVKVGNATVIPLDANGVPPTRTFYENAVYVQPGQSVEVNGIKFTNDTQPALSIGLLPMPNQTAPGYTVPDVGLNPVAPVTSQPTPAPAQPIMSPQEFADRFTVRVQMDNGSWAQVTNSLAREAFGIPVGTLMRDVDLTKLKPLPGAEGTVMAPVSRSVTTAQSSPVQTQANGTMQEAAGLLSKINNGSATHEDVKAFLSKLNEIAQLFGDAVGDGASQSGKIKGKKGVAGQAAAGVGGSGVGGTASATAALGAGAGVGVGVPAGTAGVGAAGGEHVAPQTSTGFDTTNGVAGGFSGSTTGKSWLMAIAEAMGNVLGSKVNQMLTSTSRMSSLTYDQKGFGAQSDAINDKLNEYINNHKGAAYSAEEFAKLKEEVKPAQDKIDIAMKANGQEFTLESSKLQGASQEFSMLQNAFSNAIKSIGEGLGQLARKG